MKRWLLHILLVSVLGMLAASCSQEADDPTLATEGDRVQLKFTIVLDESPASRTWGSTYDPEEATKAENTIQNMQVILFNTAGDVCYGELENVQYFATDHDTYKEYEFQGSIPVSAVGTDKLVVNDKLNCKIMVLANCAIDFSASEFNATTALNNLSYEIANIYSSSTGLKAGIPMWGIHTVSNLTVDRNYATYLPQDIYLLRSVAKIQIRLSNKAREDGFTLTPSLSHYNTKGNCQPTFPDLETGKYLPETTKTLAQESCIRANNSGKGTGLTFMGNATDGYYAYVPEYEISVVENVTNAVINLGLLKNGESTSVETTTLQFRNYVDGKPTGDKFNIVRNHIYDYVINEINDGYKMNLTCTVMDWTLVEERWDFTDQVSHDNDLLFGTYDDSGAFISSEVKSEVVTYGEDLYCQFLLDTPTGATWQAEFISVSGDKNAFVFVNGTETSETISGEVGKWAKLVIRPATANITQNNSALLRISVKTIDGRTIVVKDLLPESLGNVKEYTITHSM